MKLTHATIAALAAAAILGAVSLSTFVSAATGGPTVVLSTTASSATNATSVPVTATFSEAVNGFSASDASTTNATVSSFSGSGATYTFSLVPSAQGAFSVLIPADVATSASSTIGNQESNTLSFISDTTAPSIATVTPVPATSTTATPSFTFSSTEAGTIALTGGCTSTTTAAVSGDNALTFNALANGTYHCSLTVTDAAGNVSNALALDFTVAVPATPVISDVAVSGIGTSSATVSWKTDIAATSQVVYGTTASYGLSSTLDSTATTSHSVTLDNLAEGTLYHFAVVSSNGSSTATSSDMVFVTLSTASSTPLAETGVTSVQSNATADDTFVHGWQWVMHLTVPDVEQAFRMKFSDFTGSAGTIPAASDIRIFSPESSNATDESSAVYATGNNYGGWLYLTGDTATTTPGRQIDVTIEVRVPSGTPTGSYTTTFGAQSVPQTATSTTPL